MPTKILINKAERRGDNLVADVTYVFTGTVNDSVNVEVQCFQPKSVSEVQTAITNRGVSEKNKFIAVPTIEQIIIDLPTEFES